MVVPFKCNWTTAVWSPLKFNLPKTTLSLSHYQILTSSIRWRIDRNRLLRVPVLTLSETSDSVIAVAF